MIRFLCKFFHRSQNQRNTTSTHFFAQENKEEEKQEEEEEDTESNVMQRIELILRNANGHKNSSETAAQFLIDWEHDRGFHDD